MSLPSSQIASKLKELNFYAKKWVDDTQAENLAQILEQNTSITFVGFRECRQIGDKGAAFIAGSLQNNHTLKKISFESTGVGNNGAIEFARALSMPHCHLHRLDLSYCNIGDKGGCALARALACESSTLGILMLEHCIKLTNKTGDLFIEALQVNGGSLSMLSLKGTSISADVRSTIDKIIKQQGNSRKGKILARKSVNTHDPEVVDDEQECIKINDIDHSQQKVQQIHVSNTEKFRGSFKEIDGNDKSILLSRKLHSQHIEERRSVVNPTYIAKRDTMNTPLVQMRSDMKSNAHQCSNHSFLPSQSISQSSSSHQQNTHKPLHALQQSSNLPLRPSGRSLSILKNKLQQRNKARENGTT